MKRLWFHMTTSYVINYSKTTFLFAITICLFVSMPSFAQDTSRMYQLLALADSINKTDPTTSITYANEAATIALEVDNQDILQLALRTTTDGYYRLNLHDSMRHYQKLRMSYADKANDFKSFAATKKEYANDLIYLYGKPKDAVRQFEELAEHHKTQKDTVDQVLALFLAGQTLHRLDGYDEAMLKLSESIALAEQVGEERMQGESIELLAIIQKQLGDLDRSLQLHERSRKLFEKNGYEAGLAGNYNNVGIVYKELGDYKKSLEFYAKFYTWAKETNYTKGLMAYHGNVSTIYNLMKQYKEGKYHADKCFEFALIAEDELVQADAKKSKAQSLLGLQYYQLAHTEIQTAIDLASKNGALEKEKEAHQTAKEIYVAMGQPKKAIAHMEAYQTLGDTIFQIARTKQVNEIQEQYESAKKDAEILELNKNAEIASIKNKSLILGLISLGVIGLLAIIGLVQRHKKKQAISEKERQIEKLKHQETEQQLEFKKKELTAKALQLAKKNEFLQSLEHEVSDLQSSVDNAVGKTSSKITRMIQRDIVDDESWKQFGKEFSSVHQEFLNRLREQYGKFTKGEMRLISLMRMNMASKDIASILGVSDQGVKKARYRVRKKMNLQPTDDIQGIIVGL